MSEQSFEEMLDETFKTIHTGEVVDGTVIDVKEDQIILNIGYKADGIITRNEYSSTPGIDLTTVVSVGDTMQAKVLKVNDGEGQVLLTYRRLVADNGNKKLEEAFGNPAKEEDFEKQLLDAIKNGNRSVEVYFYSMNITRRGDDIIPIKVPFQKILSSWGEEADAVRGKMIDYLKGEGFIILETIDAEEGDRIGNEFMIALDYESYKE